MATSTVERSNQRMDAGRLGSHLARRRQVMVGSALIAHSRGHYDQLTHGNVFRQHTSTAAGDELAAAARNHILQQAGRERPADAGMIERQPFAIQFNLVQRVRAVLPVVLQQDARLPFNDHRVQYLFEKADQAVLWHILWLDEFGWFNHRFRSGVKLKDGKGHGWVILRV